MEPLRGNGLYIMDAMLVYLIVDFFFGGKVQTHVKPEGREFPPIQVRLVKKLVQQALQANKDIAVATANLAVARASLRGAKSDRLRQQALPDSLSLIRRIDEEIAQLRPHAGDMPIFTVD